MIPVTAISAGLTKSESSEYVDDNTVQGTAEGITAAVFK